MLKKIIAGVAIATTFSPALHASEAKFYVLGGAGLSYFDDNSGGDKEGATSFTLGGGVKVNENLAFEVNYHNFGDVKDSDPTTSTKLTSTALAIGMVGTLPMNERASIYARADIMAIDIDLKASASGTTVKASSNGYSPSIGIGFDYKIADTVNLRAQVQRTFYDEDIVGLDLEVDIDNYSAIVTKSF